MNVFLTLFAGAKQKQKLSHEFIFVEIKTTDFFNHISQTGNPKILWNLHSI